MRSGLFHTLLVVLVICASGRVPCAAASGASEESAARAPGDQWMEIDLYWFEQKDLSSSVNEFWQRFSPLYSDVEGYKGVVLNVGWTVNYIMEFSGDLQQQISLPIGCRPETSKKGCAKTPIIRGISLFHFRYRGRR
jgi:hypothetical protein